MDQQLYAALAGRASDLVVAGEHLKAIEILEELVASDLPALDRAYMCMNIAIVHDQRGDAVGALETYASAVDLERPTGSYFVAQARAAYYSKLGMYDEACRSYDELLRHQNLTPEDRGMFAQNIGTLQKLRG